MACGGDTDALAGPESGCRVEVHEFERPPSPSREPVPFPLEVRNEGEARCTGLFVRFRRSADDAIEAARGPFALEPGASLSGFDDVAPEPSEALVVEVLVEEEVVARLETVGGRWPIRLLAVPNELFVCAPGDRRTVTVRNLSAHPMRILGAEAIDRFQLVDGETLPDGLEPNASVELQVEARFDSKAKGAESGFGVITLSAEHDGVISTAGAGGQVPSRACTN